MDRDKLLDRIRRLLRLAESSNVHEAASAAARAQELMTRHRIAAAALDQDDGSEAGIVDHRAEPLDGSKRLRRWKTHLAVAVAQANGCRVYVLPRGKQRELILVGRAEDAELVRGLYEALRVQIEALTRKHCAGQERSYRNAFRLGAVSTLTERLELARKQAAHRALHPGEADADDDQGIEGIDGIEDGEGSGEVSAPDATLALARLDARDDAVDRFVEQHLNLKPGKRRTLRADAQGYARGRIAGHSVEL